MTSGERAMCRHQRGFGYLMMLFAMAAMGITLASAGEVWRTASQREKEAQLLFVGHQFRLALASYRDLSPEGSPNAPATLEELLQDKRFPTPVPHLRRLWRDPMTNSTDWVVVKPGGRISGVHTSHIGEPMRKVHEPQDATLNGTTAYSQWVFEAAPAITPGPASPDAAPINNNASGGAS